MNLLLPLFLSTVGTVPEWKAWRALDHHPEPFLATSPDQAIIIGIDNYANLPDVASSEIDAHAVCEWLPSLIGINPLQVSCLTGSPATGPHIRTAIKAANRRSTQESLVWVYFAGHGTLLADGTSVILPYEAPSFNEGLSLTALERVATRGGRPAIFILESAFQLRGPDGAPLADAPADAHPPHPSAAEWRAAVSGGSAVFLDLAKHGLFTWAVLGSLMGWAAGVRDPSRRRDWIGGPRRSSFPSTTSPSPSMSGAETPNNRWRSHR